MQSEHVNICDGIAAVSILIANELNWVLLELDKAVEAYKIDVINVSLNFTSWFQIRIADAQIQNGGVKKIKL